MGGETFTIAGAGLGGGFEGLEDERRFIRVSFGGCGGAAAVVRGGGRGAVVAAATRLDCRGDMMKIFSVGVFF